MVEAPGLAAEVRPVGKCINRSHVRQSKKQNTRSFIAERLDAELPTCEDSVLTKPTNGFSGCILTDIGSSDVQYDPDFTSVIE